MNVPLLVARRHGRLVPETSSQDRPASKVPPSIFVQPEEAPQKPLIGNGSNSNEPVVPIEELRLLAKTRQTRKPRSGDRARIAVFFTALMIIAAGAAGHRYLYAEGGRAAGDVQDVVPQQPPSHPAPQLAQVEEADAATADSFKAAAQEAPASVSTGSAETVSTGLLNQRLDAAVRELATLRALVQQLADKQEETTRNIAEVQAKAKAARQPLPPPPPRAATPTPRKPASRATPPETPPEPARAAAQVPPPSASTIAPDSRALIPRPPMPLRSD